MPVKVVLEPGEHAVGALIRLNTELEQQFRSNWIKRRLGHYEQPSVLRRRREIVESVTRRRVPYGLGPFRRNVRFRERLAR